MANLKPIIILATMLLAVVMLWQVASITGFLTNETIPANVTIGDAPPTIDTITCGNNNDITPLACQNTTVTCYGLVTDTNGVADIQYVKGDLINRDTGKGMCLAGTGDPADNPGNCYYDHNCTYAAVNSTTRNYTCTFSEFRYYTMNADSYAVLNWSGRFYVTDSTGTVSRLEERTILVNDLKAIDVVETFLNFGSMILGQNTANDSAVNSTIMNCGNILNVYLNVSGTNLPCSSQGTITVGNLKYNLTDVSEYADDVALTTTSTDSGADAKVAINDIPTTLWGKTQIFWKIGIPSTGVKGLCTGNITFYAI